MAAISERLQKLKQATSSKVIDSPSSVMKNSIPIQSNQTLSSPCNTIGVTLNSAAPPNTIALDSGAYSIKVGDCTDKKPLTNVIPNCILKAKAERKRVFIGNEIDDCRDLSGLYYQLPCDHGYVTRWDLQKTIWTHTVKPYLNDDTTLIMTQPTINFKESQEAMDEIFFEEYYIKAICRRYASDYLVFNHMQRHANDGTCIVVDSGYSATWIIPYVDGVVYKKGLMRIDIGGKVLTNHMKEILSYRQLNVMEETYVINQMKEDACYVARSFNRDMHVAKRTGSDNSIARTYVLPDFNTIRRGYIAEPDSDLATLANSYQLLRLNNERFTVPELLFQPGMIGFQQMGVAEAIAHTINRMPSYMQRTLCGNVVLSGGCTKLLGFKNRLGKDLRSLTPSKYAVELFVSADPVTWAWRCAASFAKRSDLLAHCVTRAQYEEFGSRYIYDKFEAPWSRDIDPADSTFTEETRPSLFNYNENIFAMPKDNEIDSEIITLSDTEMDIIVDQPKPKTSATTVPSLSPLSNSNHVQTRSSQLVLNCPPLIITGPSAQATRTVQPRKIQIEQCLSIVGGRVVDQTAQCLTTPLSSPKQQTTTPKQQSTTQDVKPMYMTDGKRLYRTAVFRTKTTKKSTSSKPKILNPGYVASTTKPDKPNKKQTLALVQRSHESKQPQQKHIVIREVHKIQRSQVTNKLQVKVKVAETKPSSETSVQAVAQEQQSKKPKLSNEAKTLNLFAVQNSSSSQHIKTKQSIESKVITPSFAALDKMSAVSTNPVLLKKPQIKVSKQLTEYKISTATALQESTSPVKAKSKQSIETTSSVLESSKPLQVKAKQSTASNLQETTLPVKAKSKPLIETTSSVLESSKPLQIKSKQDATALVKAKSKPSMETTSSDLESSKPLQVKSKPSTALALEDSTAPVKAKSKESTETTSSKLESSKSLQVKSKQPKTSDLEETTAPVKAKSKPSTETTSSELESSKTLQVKSKQSTESKISTPSSAQESSTTTQVKSSKQSTDFKTSSPSLPQMVKSKNSTAQVASTTVIPAEEVDDKLKESTDAKTTDELTASPKTPQKIVLKRRFDPPKKPVDLTTSPSSSYSPNALMRLDLLSKESMHQLHQVAKVILEQLPQSTLAAATASVDVVTNSIPTTNNQQTTMELDDAMKMEPYDANAASTSNGAGARSSRPKRGIITLKRRFDD